ncbi:MAG: tetratricopeptide repeat protein [Deltaproteobacteria bacterium]|nr:tetratricopeptide repeat protein [Deltaproteobacteria bacterium]MBI4374727.1 tetratricopeptide repeat protein [Deltaproteobacteria bacterium]
MILSGTLIGFISVGAIFLASLLMVYLDRKEKANGTGSRFFSRAALFLFIAAFIGGVTVTLLGGIQPRTDAPRAMGNRGAPSSDLGGPASPASPNRGEPTPSLGEPNQEEVHQLEEKVKKEPHDTASRERLAHLYLQASNYEKVFELTHEVLQIKPDSTESRVHMAMVLFSMQEVNEAIAQIDQALTKEPNNLEALAFKGMIQLNGQNDPKEAKKTWQKYLKKAKEGDVGWGMVNALIAGL